MASDLGTQTFLAALRGSRAQLVRTGTAERAADVLRERIIDATLPPGTRLAEDTVSAALGVSRNTLRESFRLLAHEGLLIHRLNRGVFVRQLSCDEVRDIYRLRRMLECSAVLGLRRPDLTDVETAVLDGEQAAAAADWVRVGTADLCFHQALVALVGSRRADDVMRGVLAELRLAFQVVADPRRLHETYLPRNRRILELLSASKFKKAADELQRYLDDAQRQLCASYPPSERLTGDGGGDTDQPSGATRRTDR